MKSYASVIKIVADTYCVKVLSENTEREECNAFFG